MKVVRRSRGHTTCVSFSEAILVEARKSSAVSDTRGAGTSPFGDLPAS